MMPFLKKYRKGEFSKTAIKTNISIFAHLQNCSLFWVRKFSQKHISNLQVRWKLCGETFYVWGWEIKFTKK